MKKLFLNLFSVSLIFLQSSCSKEEALKTQAELTAIELQNVIHTRKPQRVVAVGYNEMFPNSFSSATGVSYSFSNGFILIDGYSRTFNLTYLKAYDIANVIIHDGTGPVTTSSALILYFQ